MFVLRCVVCHIYKKREEKENFMKICDQNETLAKNQT